MRILVTGGAGFIGSHLTDLLIETGHQVTVFDSLLNNDGNKPDYLNAKAALITADLSKDYSTLKKAVQDSDAIFHLAAKVGIGQSNYDITQFVNNNCVGTSNLLQAITETETKPKLVVAASNTEYGEGTYFCSNCSEYRHPEIRTAIIDGFEIQCYKCKNTLKPVPTGENTQLNANSIYALTKKFQEESAMMVGRLYGFPVVALRFFNVFGPRQSLSNPYTGVSAIFTTRIKNDKPVVIYEDGKQTRDFIYVSDVVAACLAALESNSANYNSINIGSGISTPILELANILYRFFDMQPNIVISKEFRKGDIRHCFANLNKSKDLLNWKPKVALEDGIKSTMDWAAGQESTDLFDQAARELKVRKLT